MWRHENSRTPNVHQQNSQELEGKYRGRRAAHTLIWSGLGILGILLSAAVIFGYAMENGWGVGPVQVAAGLILAFAAPITVVGLSLMVLGIGLHLGTRGTKG